METAKKHFSYCIVFLMLCLTGMILFGHSGIAEAAGSHDTYVGGKAYDTYVGGKGCVLTFQKEWEDDGDTSKRPDEITFTVDLANTNHFAPTTPDVPITLKASDNWTFTYPQTSFGYYPGTLKELKVDGYKLDGVTTTVEGNKVIVTLKNKLEQVKATGSLTVSKTVAGNAGDKEKAFHFTVTLSDQTISGTYGDMEFTDGVANFTLKHGESKTAEGLPAGVTYEVTETEADQDGYATAKTGDTGTIEKDVISTAAFTNMKDEFGSLTASKTVAGNAGDQQKAFNFTVRLSDTSINGTFGDMTFTDGVATFTLKHGESKTATGLPAGITYTVAEDDYSDDGYVTTKTGDMGTIAKDGTSTAVFTNTKDVTPIDPDPDDSSLTVKKEWILDDGGKATDSVTVVLLRDGKEYEKVELSDRNNWTFTWTGLSDGYTWTVDEVNVPDGFTAKVDQNGMIFTITNDDKPTDPGDPTDPDKPTDDVPKTGDETNLTLWLVLLGIFGMGAIITLLGSKRK